MHTTVSTETAPYVAVWMVTYNHEKYIGAAIEGVLMQKTNFKVKLFIGEDCSTDNTKNICTGYAEKYPERIQVMSTLKNNLKQNVDGLWKTIISSGARYVATNDGDDYWTDPEKLQKQVDFLDANPEFSMCFTNIDIIDESGVHHPYHFSELNKKEINFEDILLSENNLIFNSTCMFRNILPYPLPKVYINTYVGDIVLHLLFTDTGKAGFIKDITAVYRKHSAGISKSDQHFSNEYLRIFMLFEDLNKHFNYKYDRLFRSRLHNISKTVLIYESRDKKGFRKIKHVTKMFPKYLKYADRINKKEVFYFLSILFLPFILKLKGKR